MGEVMPKASAKEFSLGGGSFIRITSIGGELYESVGVEAPMLLSYTHTSY